MSRLYSLWTFALLAGLAAAHGGHENVPEGEAVSVDPLVSSLAMPDSASNALNTNDRRTRHYGFIFC